MRPLYAIPIRYLLLIMPLFSGSLIRAQVKVYGMTSGGGASGYGVLFSMGSDGSNYKPLYSFSGKPDGGNPYGAVVMGTGTVLYGTTRNGGANRLGTIFSFDTATQTYQKLADFTVATGMSPSGDLVWFNNKFYGLAPLGGANGLGTVFSYDPATAILSDVYDLTVTTGANPYGNLTALNSKLYFTTTLGGSNKGGTLAVFDPSARTCIDLHDFGVLSYSRSGLAVLNNILYGTNQTKNGSASGGGIFSYDPGSGIYTDVLPQPDYMNGLNPTGLTAYNGLLYGTMQIEGPTNTSGGSTGGGSVYTFDPATATLKALNLFDNLDNPGGGAGPMSPPLITSTGQVIGMTFYGGSSNLGVVYKYDSTSDLPGKLLDFTSANGEGPMYGQLFEPASAPVALPIGLIRFTGVGTPEGRVLDWSAAQSTAGSWFQLQRSTDANTFLGIDSVAASAQPFDSSYTYTDAAPLPGVNVVYYRVNIRNAGGAASYSNIVAIGLDGNNGDGLQLINTVVTGTAFLQYTTTAAGGMINLRVVNLNGQVMLQQNLPVSKGVNSYSLDVQALPKGMYMIQGGNKSIKFLRL